MIITELFFMIQLNGYPVIITELFFMIQLNGYPVIKTELFFSDKHIQHGLLNTKDGA